MQSSRLTQFILASERRHGQTPSAQTLAGWAGVSIEEAQTALDEHLGAKKAVAQKAEEKKVEAKIQEVTDLSRPVLKWTSLVIAGACVAWSWGNVFSYYESSPWGALISTVTTAVLFVFPQTARLQKRGAKALHYTLFGLSLAFAMTTTVNANYNWRTAAVTRALEASQAQGSADTADAQILEIQGALTRLGKEQDQLLADAAKHEVGTWERNRVDKALTASKAESEKLTARLESLKKEKTQAQTVARKSRDDLFTWVEKATGWKAETVEFWISIIPAIIADVAGPVALRVFLFL